MRRSARRRGRPATISPGGAAVLGLAALRARGRRLDLGDDDRRAHDAGRPHHGGARRARAGHRLQPGGDLRHATRRAS